MNTKNRFFAVTISPSAENRKPLPSAVSCPAELDVLDLLFGPSSVVQQPAGNHCNRGSPTVIIASHHVSKPKSEGIVNAEILPQVWGYFERSGRVLLSLRNGERIECGPLKAVE